MNYYIWQVPGQLKSECTKTTESLEQIEASLRKGEYGLRQVSAQEYLEEIKYNNSKSNPWN